jgi:SAM-dependent methyltransferase
MPKRLDADALLAQWQDEERAPFKGWDFSHLHGRYVEDTPPWSYESLVRALLPTSTALLDLGTAGGERLLTFRDLFPAKVAATEEYLPNLALARERLQALGVTVYEAHAAERGLIPVPDASFDLVINRHTGFNVREVERALSPGGVLLTEQVDGTSGHDLCAAFGSRPKWPYYTLSYVLQQVAATTLVVDLAQEWAGRMIFADVGAIVYYLKATPWLVDNFSVATHLPYLEQQQKRLEKEGQLVFTHKLLVVRARKSG